MEGTGVSIWRGKRCPYGWDSGVTIEGTGLSLRRGQESLPIESLHGVDRGVHMEGKEASLWVGQGCHF